MGTEEGHPKRDMGCSCFSGACNVLDVAAYATLACGSCDKNGLFPPLFFVSPFPFPFYEGIPLKESFPFIISFLLVIFPCCKTFALTYGA